MSLSLVELKSQIKEIIPSLVMNRDLAYQEWMDGKIAKGAFHYVQQRLDLAYGVMEGNILDMEGNIVGIDVDKALKACAILTIDLRSVVKDDVEKNKILNGWLEFYRKSGFTEMNKIYNIPTRPSSI